MASTRTRPPHRRSFWPAIAVLSLLAALAVGGAVSGVALGLGSAPCGARTLELDGDEASLAATFVGDTMLGDAAQPLLDEHGYDWPFERIRGVVETDFLMANAEGPITIRTEPYDADQGWNYNALPVAATALRNFGVDALSLANNHAMDRGPEGLADTAAAAIDAGIETVGSSRSLCEAELPLLVHTPAGTLGIVSLGMPYGRNRTAALAHPGSIAMSPVTIARGAALARAAGADWLVAFVHWGQNYRQVTDQQRASAAQFAAAGYDLVIGAHPHVFQGIEIVSGMPVVYSVGNFVFGAAGRFDAGTGFGLVVRATFDRSEGLQLLGFRCIVTDNEIVGYQPRLCTTDEAETVLPSLNPNVVVTGDRGILTLP